MVNSLPLSKSRRKETEWYTDVGKREDKADITIPSACSVYETQKRRSGCPVPQLLYEIITLCGKASVNLSSDVKDKLSSDVTFLWLRFCDFACDVSLALTK